MSTQKHLPKLSRFNEKIFGTHNKRVVFFFAGMGTRTWLYTFTIRRLVRHGYKVVAYDFAPGVVKNGDAGNFLEVAERVSQSVRRHIQTFQSTGSTSFAVFGVSMGTLMAIKVAGENEAITKVIINMTYGSVAENVWTWKFVESTKRKSIEQGYTMETLDRKLAPVSPIPNAEYLKGKDVLLYLSTKDKILVFEQSRQFKDALDRHGVNYTYIQNDKRGHIIGGYQHMHNHAVWLGFLLGDQAK